MSEMIERVAKAMFEDAGGKPVMRSVKAHYLAMARAAIAAMREPTDEMLATAHVTWFAPEHSPHSSPRTIRPHFTKLWRAMIDEALR